MAENRELALVLKLMASQFQDELKKSGGMVGEFSKFIGDWKTQLTLAGTAVFTILLQHAAKIVQEDAGLFPSAGGRRKARSGAYRARPLSGLP